MNLYATTTSKSTTTVSTRGLPEPPSTWAEKAFVDYGTAGAVGSGDSYDRAAYASVYDEVKSELVEMGERGRDLLASYSDRWNFELRNESRVRVGICAAVGGGACGSAVAWIVLSSLAPLGAVTGAITGAIFALTSDRVRRRSKVTKLLCAWSRVCAAAVLAVTARVNLTARSAYNDVNEKYGDVFANARERTGEFIDSAAIGQQTAAFIQTLTDAVNDAKIDEKVRSAAQTTNQFFTDLFGSNTSKKDTPNNNDQKYLHSLSDRGSQAMTSTGPTGPFKHAQSSSTANKRYASSRENSFNNANKYRGNSNHPRPASSLNQNGQSFFRTPRSYAQPYTVTNTRKTSASQKMRHALSNLNPFKSREPPVFYLAPPPPLYNPYFVAAIPALMIIAYDHSEDITRIGTFLIRVLTAAYNGAALEASAAAGLFY